MRWARARGHQRTLSRERCWACGLVLVLAWGLAEAAVTAAGSAATTGPSTSAGLTRAQRPERGGASFNFDVLVARAAAAAARPYDAAEAAGPALPPALAHLSYDQVRDIRYRPSHALWRDEGLPFQLMFFHRSGRQPDAVKVHVVSESGEHTVPYRASDFDFGANQALAALHLHDIGLAGWRVHFPLNQPGRLDELAVFLGASYFRALGRAQRYGLSARALVINPLGPGPEEFPRFTEYWLITPKAGDRTFTFFALLASPSVCGAYRFDLTPGDDTTVAVHASVFARAAVQTLGIAPLTTMFLSGENQPAVGDFRPEVHDSDGLMVALGGPDGEWLWRPLINPPEALLTSFEAYRLRGFGLMQRDRAFSSYEDTEARYELRPSVWVEPLGDWGAGRVDLLQLHAADETVDNVTAFWRASRTPLAKGQRLDFAYRLHWQGAQDQKPPQAWVVQSRRGHGWQVLPPDQVQYVVDFAGPALQSLPPQAPVEAVVTAGGNGQVVHSNAFFNEAAGTWRMTVNVRWTNRSSPLELRGFLRLGPRALTETWSPITVSP